MQQCQYEHCTCEIGDDTAVSKDGKLFCSKECAEGRGCTHSECGCKTQSSGKNQRDEDPDIAKSAASNPASKGNPTKPAPSHNPGHHTTHNPAQGNPAIRGNPEAGKRDTERSTQR